MLAANWGRMLKLLRGGMGVADVVPSGLLTNVTAAARTVLPLSLIHI